MENVIYATSIKDRLPMLKQSLPFWLRQPHRYILILDWDSPDQKELIEFINDMQDGTIWVAAAKDRKFYEHSRCRNIKTALAMLLPGVDESQFIFSIDSDIIVKSNPMAEIEDKWQSKDALYIFGGVENGWMPHSAGTSIHTIRGFLEAGGCDENMQGWGREDLKFFANMSKTMVKTVLPTDTIEHIPHDDRERTKHCEEKNKWRSNAKNGFLMTKPNSIYARDFDIELISPDMVIRTIKPEEDLYKGKIAELSAAGGEN